jgi:hypothetical protein
MNLTASDYEKLNEISERSVDDSFVESSACDINCAAFNQGTFLIGFLIVGN